MIQLTKQASSMPKWIILLVISSCVHLMLGSQPLDQCENDLCKCQDDLCQCEDADLPQCEEDLTRCLLADLPKCNVDKTQLEAVKTQLKADKTHLEADMSHLEADMSHLEADMSKLEADMSQLEADMSQLEADKAQCETDKAQCETDKTQCQADKVALEEVEHCVWLVHATDPIGINSWFVPNFCQASEVSFKIGCNKDATEDHPAISKTVYESADCTTGASEFPHSAICKRFCGDELTLDL